MSGAVALRHRRFWLGLWWCAVLAVIAVCLLPPAPLPELPQNSDKLEHFLAYFILAGSGIQLWRGRRALSALGIGLVGLGLGIELAQSLLTSTRVADAMDALANTIGVFAGISLAATPLGRLLQHWQPPR